MPNPVIQRVALTANIARAVSPPEGHLKSLTVGNAGNDDIRIWDGQNDSTQYRILSAGYERLFPLTHSANPTAVLLYIWCLVANTAVLEWD